MDPNTNIKDQRKLANELLSLLDRWDLPTIEAIAQALTPGEASAVEAFTDDVRRLCELVEALDEWRRQGGFDPYASAAVVSRRVDYLPATVLRPVVPALEAALASARQQGKTIAITGPLADAIAYFEPLAAQAANRARLERIVGELAQGEQLDLGDGGPVIMRHVAGLPSYEGLGASASLGVYPDAPGVVEAVLSYVEGLARDPF